MRKKRTKAGEEKALRGPATGGQKLFDAKERPEKFLEFRKLLSKMKKLGIRRPQS